MKKIRNDTFPDIVHVTKIVLMIIVVCTEVILMPVVIAGEEGDREGETITGEWESITEFAGIVIADQKAKNWDPDAKLIKIAIWKYTIYREFDVISTIGWQYFYRSRNKYLKVSIDVDDYHRNDTAKIRELSKEEAVELGLENLKPLSEFWNVLSWYAIKIASDAYGMSLKRGDYIGDLYLSMRDVKRVAIPVWHLSIVNGVTGVKTNYMIDANTGSIIYVGRGRIEGQKVEFSGFTEIAGIDIVDQKAKNWDPNAKLILIGIWKVESRIHGDDSRIYEEKLNTTGWTYFYRSGNKYLRVSIDVDDYVNNTAETRELSKEEAVESLGLEKLNLKPLNKWNVVSLYAMEIASDAYGMSLKRGDLITCRLYMRDIKGTAIPVLHINIGDGVTGLETDYVINANTGKIISGGKSDVKIEFIDFESRVIKGQINTFEVEISNYGDYDVYGVVVEFKEGAKFLGNATIPVLLAGEIETVSYRWDTKDASPRVHEIAIAVRPELFDEKGPKVKLFDSIKVKANVLPSSKASTLIVTNFNKLSELWGENETAVLEEKLIELSFHPSVNGIIIKVKNETNNSELYEEWDNDKTPGKANEIAETIKSLIDSKLKDYPNIEYLIIVGDDRIIPFYRIKDNTKKSHIGPDWKDESDYFKESCISDRSAVGLALSQGYYFTDDFYADFKQEKLPINVHVPEKPIGRLVESPEEIMSLIDTFLTTYDLYPKSIFVTGCGFMSDGCMSSVHAWAGVKKTVYMVNSPNEVNYNSSEEIRDAILNKSNTIMAIFQHADYSGFTNIPGGKGVSDPCDLTASEVSNSTRIEGAIVYAMSCHSGLNVPPEESNSLDLVQSFVRKGVLAYVAPTGYGMGGLVTVAGHEKLLKYFTEQLCNGKDVGDALISAKRDYYLNNFHMDYLDEKVVSSTVLYGLPMYRLSKETGAEEERVQIMGTTQNGEMQKMQMEELEIYTLTLRPKLKPEENSSESGKPILPMATWPYVIDKNKIHGITLDSAEYDFAEDVIRCIETFALSDDQEAPTYDNKDWYPSQFFKINTVGEMQKMVVVTGQFKMKYQVSLTAYNGSERQFRELSFDIYLSPKEAEEEKPVINRVECPKKGNATFVRINATDNSGILKAIVTYTDRNSSNGVWVSMEAEKDAQKPNEYMCELKGDVEFFVQAVDVYGNVAVDDSDGQYYPEKEENLPGQP